MISNPFVVQISIFVLYIAVLTVFSARWKQSTGPIKSYTLNGDMRMLMKDNIVFDRKLNREFSNCNFKNDTEKCEWVLEKMKDMFQFFNVADVTLWPYQLVVSFLGSIMVCYQLNKTIDFRHVLSIMFLIFVIIDLPRRFLSFHKNALISNKALNIYNFYYKNMKGQDVDDNQEEI